MEKYKETRIRSPMKVNAHDRIKFGHCASFRGVGDNKCLSDWTPSPEEGVPPAKANHWSGTRSIRWQQRPAGKPPTRPPPARPKPLLPGRRHCRLPRPLNGGAALRSRFASQRPAPSAASAEPPAPGPAHPVLGGVSERLCAVLCRGCCAVRWLLLH